MMKKYLLLIMLIKMKLMRLNNKIILNNKINYNKIHNNKDKIKYWI